MFNNNNDQIIRLHDAIEQSNYTVTITGAGISIAAGGVTYSGMRSRSGGRAMFSGDPEEMYEAYYRSFLGSMFEHGPTFAHKALAELESEGKMQGIITTNVDCLHTMAGSKNVAEIQGSFQVNVCTGCGKWIYGYDIWNHGKMPVCDECGSIVLPYNMYSHAGIYGDGLQKAQEMMSKAELILIIGATGCYTHMYWDYKRAMAKVIQINPGRTYFDRVTDMNIRRESDPVFKELMSME